MLGLLERVEQEDIETNGQSLRGHSGASVCLPEGIIKGKS